MLVVAIMALAAKLVFMNAGLFIPSWQMNGEARKLATQMTYVASEAKMQGRTLKIEFDIDNSAYRILLPPDFGLALVDEKEPPMLPTNWVYLDEPVKIDWIEIGTKDQHYTDGKVIIAFDPLGTSVDAGIHLVNPNEEGIDVTLILHGITSLVDIEKGEVFLKEINENAF